MTKQALQKEILEKVKPGTKPSHLKKLKRSKSDSDIPSAPTSPTLKIKQLETELTKITQQKSLFQEQLKEKQNEIESLRETSQSLRQRLETQSEPTNTEFDQSLITRHQSLKDWFTQYSQKKKLDQELEKNIDEASQELINQDQTISQLRGQVKNLELTNQSLTKDLNLSQRLAEYRKNPLPDHNPHSSNLLVYAFLTFWFITLLNSSWKERSYNSEPS